MGSGFGVPGIVPSHGSNGQGQPLAVRPFALRATPVPTVAAKVLITATRAPAMRNTSSFSAASVADVATITSTTLYVDPKTSARTTATATTSTRRRRPPRPNSTGIDDHADDQHQAE